MIKYVERIVERKEKVDMTKETNSPSQDYNANLAKIEWSEGKCCYGKEKISPSQDNGLNDKFVEDGMEETEGEAEMECRYQEQEKEE